MARRFFLNNKTHCLHIEGFCYQTKVAIYNVSIFDTEEAARAEGGQAVWLCKVCQGKREKITTTER